MKTTKFDATKFPDHHRNRHGDISWVSKPPGALLEDNWAYLFHPGGQTHSQVDIKGVPFEAQQLLLQLIHDTELEPQRHVSHSYAAPGILNIHHNRETEEGPEKHAKRVQALADANLATVRVIFFNNYGEPYFEDKASDHLWHYARNYLTEEAQ